MAVIFLLLMSCTQNNKYSHLKKELTDNKMISILVDVFLMEAYLSEKAPSMQIDSLAALKNNYYNAIFTRHKVDSIEFYSTLYYYQNKPIEFDSLLTRVNKQMQKIKPTDTLSNHATKPEIHIPPPTIEHNKLLNQDVLKQFERLKQNKLNKKEKQSAE